MFIWTFNSFDPIFLLTAGGPNQSTYVLSVHAYFAAFVRLQTGYAAAMATMMLLFMLFLSMIYMRVIRNKGQD